MSVLTSTDPALAEFAELVGATGPVAVEGHRTRWEVGGPVDADARLVRAPSGIVSYTPDEMTVTVRAGTPVAELHGELAAAGQRTALPERGGTVGGALAVGENGLYVLGRGRLRTGALQVRYISAEGEVVTGGGPTVKNVTGFDIPRLMVGSLGTLGLLAEVILRTNPIPAVSRWLVSHDADPFAVQDAVLRPGAILWGGRTTWVQLEGHPPAVKALEAGLAAVGSFVEADGPPTRPGHRWSLAPSQLRDLSALGITTFVASVGVGTVWTTFPQGPRPVDAAIAGVTERMKAYFDPTGRLNPGRAATDAG